MPRYCLSSSFSSHRTPVALLRKNSLHSYSKTKHSHKQRTVVSNISSYDISSDPTPVLVQKIVFEPTLPDTSILASQAAVLVLSVGLAAYWWNVVVPSERASLAKEKRRGPLGEYLKEINADPERKVERWFYDDWLNSSWFKAKIGRRNLSQGNQKASTVVSSASSETAPNDQVGTEPVEEVSNLSGPASGDLFQPTYNTPTPNFFSLDNPLIATAALLLLGGLFSSIPAMIKGF